ncbi:DUF6482 family protein [Vibrio sp. TBV020]|uniref:DUF6482 family protein n=1 Tax=Vibrio sp. TBV020 TaxID=3137398 RepID=UPI0038CD630D
MELLIESLEGDIYLAFQVNGDSKTPIANEYNQPIHFHSLNQIRDYCQDFPYQSASLLQHSAYDEMCGSTDIGGNTMQIDLNWY